MNDKKYSDFGDKLKEYMMQNNLSIDNVAKEAGVKKITVIRWLKGINKPHPTVRKFLFTITGEPKEDPEALKLVQ